MYVSMYVRMHICVYVRLHEEGLGFAPGEAVHVPEDVEDVGFSTPPPLEPVRAACGTKAVDVGVAMIGEQ
jgi:hypothetical protein